MCAQPTPLQLPAEKIKQCNDVGEKKTFQKQSLHTTVEKYMWNLRLTAKVQLRLKTVLHRGRCYLQLVFTAASNHCKFHPKKNKEKKRKTNPTKDVGHPRIVGYRTRSRCCASGAACSSGTTAGRRNVGRVTCLCHLAQSRRSHNCGLGCSINPRNMACGAVPYCSLGAGLSMGSFRPLRCFLCSGGPGSPLVLEQVGTWYVEHVFLSRTSRFRWQSISSGNLCDRGALCLFPRGCATAPRILA